MKMKMLITAMLSAVCAMAGMAQESGTFVLDVDAASHIIFTQGSGTPVELSDGANAITYKTWETLRIAPADGYRIESITTFDTTGNQVSTSLWWFNSQDDSYTTQFTTYNYNGYTYKVATQEYNPEMYTVTVDIDNPQAVKNGTYTIGNKTVEATAGECEVSFNPEKGNAFTMVMGKNVQAVTLTRNGAEEEGSLNGLGEMTYSFSVANGDRIKILATMETPEVTLILDNPEAVSVTFPNEDTPLENLKGNNTLTYQTGDVLTVKALEGWKITEAEGLRFSSYTNSWSYTFRGGESGKTFTVTTEPYNPPMAVLNIMLEESAFLKRVVADEVITKFEKGLNTVKINLEKETSCQLVYDVRNTGDVEATIDNEPLPIQETWIIYSDIENLEAKTYYITIGSPGWKDAVGMNSIQLNDGKATVFTLSGIPVMKDADTDALNTLPSGIYIINGKKISIKQK